MICDIIPRPHARSNLFYFLLKRKHPREIRLCDRFRGSCIWTCTTRVFGMKMVCDSIGNYGLLHFRGCWLVLLCHRLDRVTARTAMISLVRLILMVAVRCLWGNDWVRWDCQHHGNSNTLKFDEHALPSIAITGLSFNMLVRIALGDTMMRMLMLTWDTDTKITIPLTLLPSSSTLTSTLSNFSSLNHSLCGLAWFFCLCYLTRWPDLASACTLTFTETSIPP